MKKTKFIYIVLSIQCGEYGFKSKSVHEISKTKSTKKFGENCAKDFYGTKPEKDGDSYYFNGGEVAVSLSFHEEITKEEYNILNKFL